MPPESLPWNQLTHVVFAFGSLESTYNITIPTKGQVTISALFAAAKANGVKTVLSVGGWRGSTYFSEMVASNSSRSTFISSARNIIQQYDLDGIDIDWEYPGRPGDVGTPYNEITDVPNLLLLIRQMRQTLGWRVELSAALSSSKPWSSDVREFAQLLDYGSIMSYNFAGRGQIKSGAMAPLEGSASVSSGAMNWNSAGWPWHKLAMGIPGYGRSWTLEDVIPFSRSFNHSQTHP
jgi:chitinase